MFLFNDGQIRRALGVNAAIGFAFVSLCSPSLGAQTVHVLMPDQAPFVENLRREFPRIAEGADSAEILKGSIIVSNNTKFTVKAIALRYKLRFSDGHSAVVFHTLAPKPVGLAGLPANPDLLLPSQSILVTPYDFLSMAATQARTRLFVATSRRGLRFQGVDNPIDSVSIDAVIFNGGFERGEDQSGYGETLCNSRNELIREAMSVQSLMPDMAIVTAKLRDDSHLDSRSQSIDARALAHARAAQELASSMASLSSDRFALRVSILASSHEMVLKHRTPNGETSPEEKK